MGRDSTLISALGSDDVLLEFQLQDSTTHSLCGPGPVTYSFQTLSVMRKRLATLVWEKPPRR